VVRVYNVCIAVLEAVAAGGARGEHVFWAASPAALDRWGDGCRRPRESRRTALVNKRGAEQLSSLAALLWSVSVPLSLRESE
jgi:hypothetical protein